MDYSLHIDVYMFHTSFIFTHVIDAKHRNANHLRAKRFIGAKLPVTYT